MDFCTIQMEMSLLSLQMTNIWQNIRSYNIRIFAAFSPIDENFIQSDLPIFEFRKRINLYNTNKRTNSFHYHNSFVMKLIFKINLV